MNKNTDSKTGRADAIFPDSLTTREKQTAQAMLSGRSRKEISEDLGISENTLKIHFANVLHKTSCRSRLEFIAKHYIKSD